MSNVNCCLKTVPVIGHTTTITAAARSATAQQETNKCVRASDAGVVVDTPNLFRYGRTTATTTPTATAATTSTSSRRSSVAGTKSVSAWKMKNKIDAALRKEAYYTPSLSPSYGLQQQQQQQQQHQQQHQQDKTRKLKIQFTLSSDVSAYNQTLSITVFVSYFS